MKRDKGAEMTNFLHDNCPRFHPWIGSHYGRESRFGVRLLVLGESHYGQPGEDDEPRTFTQDVVRDYSGPHRHPYFTTIAKVLRGDTDWIDDEERAAIWENIAFYNYIQTLLPAPGIPPKAAQWDAGHGPFLTVLNTLQPDAVLVVGQRLWGQIEQMPRPANVECTVINHPRKMNYPDAIPAFRELMDRFSG